MRHLRHNLLISQNLGKIFGNKVVRLTLSNGKNCCKVMRHNKLTCTYEPADQCAAFFNNFKINMAGN